MRSTSHAPSAMTIARKAIHQWFIFTILSVPDGPETHLPRSRRHTHNALTSPTEEGMCLLATRRCRHERPPEQDRTSAAHPPRLRGERERLRPLTPCARRAPSARRAHADGPPRRSGPPRSGCEPTEKHSTERSSSTSSAPLSRACPRVYISYPGLTETARALLKPRAAVRLLDGADIAQVTTLLRHD